MAVALLDESGCIGGRELGDASGHAGTLRRGELDQIPEAGTIGKNPQVRQQQEYDAARLRFRFANLRMHSYLVQVALNESGVDSRSRVTRGFLLARALAMGVAMSTKSKSDHLPHRGSLEVNSSHQSLTCAKELMMIRKAMLCTWIIGGLIGLTATSSGAGAVTSRDGDRILASSEKAATEAPPRPRARTGHHYRHRGGRHPFYGSRH